MSALLTREAEELKAQRDEAVEALRCFLDWVDSRSSAQYQSFRHLEAVRDEARRVIAKVEAAS